jgi:hypothetical protein
MMFSATFNNISAISWRSVLLVEEAGENHRPAVSHRQTLFEMSVSQMTKDMFLLSGKLPGTFLIHDISQGLKQD